MARKGVSIIKGRVGPNVAGTPFRISALVTTGVAVVGKLTLGSIYELLSVDDCADLGLNNAYDITNNVVVFEHVSEFFRLGGAKLYLQVNAQTTTLADTLDDTGLAYARKVIAAGNGDIQQIAVGFNPPATGYTETAVDGINSDVRAAIVKAQGLHDWSYATDRPLNVILEGRGYSGVATAAADLRALSGTGDVLQADMVSIVIGQDWDFAETLTGLAQKHAALGTFLGTLSSCDLNQDVGEVETKNITDEGRAKWVTAGLSDHTKVADAEASLDTLYTKGYIFGDIYVGVSGYRWTQDATCTPIIVDADGNMNTHTIAYGRVMNYAERKVRAALLPFVRRRVPVDPKTGLLTTGAKKEIEGKGNQVFEDFASKGWVSDGAVTVDPNSDVLVQKLVGFSYYVVPYGVIGQLSGKANLKNKS
jgi:hypothetical protein